jgi:hypothetical protein
MNMMVLIYQAVRYSLDLDMFEFCTPALQDKMKPVRDVLRKQQEAKEEHAVFPYLSSLFLI